MKTTHIVFYAGLVLLEFNNEPEFTQWRRAACVGDHEIYNGAYLYCQIPPPGRCWYRMDLTPVLLDDVPKELRLMVLLMS